MESWKESLPVPVLDEKPEFIQLYDFAWELAHRHVRSIPGMPQNPYMDEAFCDTRIWIWDTCFMSLFCKYSPHFFPGVESFRNLLDVLHNGQKLPEVEVPAGEPAWTGSVPGQKARILIQHPDNPPLFAWAEYENALMAGDKKHLDILLHQTKVLQRHYDWLEHLTEKTDFPQCSVRTAWRFRKEGIQWGGTPSGMDNTTRGRKNSNDQSEPSKDFYWVDAIAQQALTAECIANMAAILEDSVLETEWRQKYCEIKETVNRLYWDSSDGFYYDIDNRSHAFLRIITPASFWPVLAGIASGEQAEKCAEKLRNPDLLGGKYPWVTIARNDVTFDPANGRYWHGSVWIPTAYAGTRALLRYGMHDLAREKTLAVLEQMVRTWKDVEPHTIWECYAPNSGEPAACGDGRTRVRPDFCGWSALMPISALLESVIGLFSANAFTNTLKWNIPEKISGKLGCRNYRFGKIVTDLIAEQGVVTIYSNLPYHLELNGKMMKIQAGENKFSL